MPWLGLGTAPRYTRSDVRSAPPRLYPQLRSPSAGVEPVRLEFVVRPPLGAGPSPGSGRSNGHCSARHGPPCVRRRRSTACGPSTTRRCVPRWRRPDARRHATLPQSWIQRENWEFETHRLSTRLSTPGKAFVRAVGCLISVCRASARFIVILAAVYGLRGQRGSGRSRAGGCKSF